MSIAALIFWCSALFISAGYLALTGIRYLWGEHKYNKLLRDYRDPKVKGVREDEE